MLKLIVFLIAIALNTSALACWKLQGTFAIDGENFKIDQKVDHDKTYSLPMGTFILHLTLKTGKKDTHKVQYKIEERDSGKLALVSQGDETIEVAKPKDIYAGGEKDQPHSIITLMIKDI